MKRTLFTMLAAGLMAGTMMAQNPLSGYNAPTFPKAGNCGNIVSLTTSGAMNDLNQVSVTTTGYLGHELYVVPGQTLTLTVNINTFWGNFSIFSDCNATKTMTRLMQCGNSGNPSFENHANGVTVHIEDTTQPGGSTLPSVTVPAGTAEGTSYLIRMMFIGGSDDATAYDGSFSEGTYYDIKVTARNETKKYTVTIDPNIANGSLMVKSNGQEVVSGTSITENTPLAIEFTPNSGYELKQITLNGVEYKGATFAITENSTLSAEFTTLPATGSGLLLEKGATSLRVADEIIGDHVSNQPTQDSRTHNYTLSAWVSPMAYNGWFMGHMQRIHWNAQGSFAVGVQEGKLAVNYRKWAEASSGDLPDAGTVVSPNTTLNPQEYAFVTFVSDHANKTFRVYKNGELALEQVITDGVGLALLFDPTNDFFFGDNRQGLMSSKVEEIQIWTKALTAEEIKESMYGGYTADNKPAELAGYYVVGTSTTVDNLVSDSHDAVLRSKSGDTVAEGNTFPVANAAVATNGRPMVTLTVTAEGGTAPAAVDVKQYSVQTVAITAEDGKELSALTINGAEQDIEDATIVTENEGVYSIVVKVADAPVTVAATFASTSALGEVLADCVRFADGKLYMGQNARAYVFSATGALVATGTDAVTDLSHLPSGVYVAKVLSGNSARSIRFVK